MNNEVTYNVLIPFAEWCYVSDRIQKVVLQRLETPAGTLTHILWRSPVPKAKLCEKMPTASNYALLINLLLISNQFSCEESIKLWSINAHCKRANCNKFWEFR